MRAALLGFCRYGTRFFISIPTVQRRPALAGRYHSPITSAQETGKPG